MLIEFSVANFLSFKEPVTFSMVSSKTREFIDTNVIQNGDLKILKSAMIYGANGSGKSNLFQAMKFMDRLVINSSKETQAEESIAVRPFRLSTETENEPSSFEIVFVYEDTRYRYGFQVNKTSVVNEWLFYMKHKSEIKLFNRSYDNFEVCKEFIEGKGLEEKTRKNALFLSVVAQFNGEISTKILKWFSKQFNIISGLNNRYEGISTKLIKDKEIKDLFDRFLNFADLGIYGLEVEEEEVALKDLPKRIQEILRGKIDDESLVSSIEIKTLHRKYDKNKNVVSFERFDLDKQESEGTRKLYSILGPILDSLKNGKVLVIDELDSSLHPILTKYLIELFNSKENNPFNAQLIFNTQDTNLLSNKLFRRDQIWFAEKDRYGETHLYSLVDYSANKGIERKDATYGKNYLMGKYGAIPYLGQFQFFLTEEDGK
jgi:AAA15 family ATPase/GTPase